jgi:hypothetical protein
MIGTISRRPNCSIRYNLSLSELKIAIATTIDLAQLIQTTKGPGSRDYQTAWNILTAMQSELIHRGYA